LEHPGGRFGIIETKAMRQLKRKIKILLEYSQKLGIRDEDLNNAIEFLDYNEFELCFDTIITQMYEYDIKIDEKFFQLVEEIGTDLKLPVNAYFFMKELITPINSMPN
jgi:hypothetical protein